MTHTPAEVAAMEAENARIWAEAPTTLPPPDDDEPETCWRCKGSCEIPYGNDPLGRDLYDPCPECDPEA